MNNYIFNYLFLRRTVLVAIFVVLSLIGTEVDVAEAVKLNGGGDRPSLTLCYTCIYYKSIHDDEEHYQGDPHCADPFKGNDIPKIACSGPCSKNIMIPRKNEYMLTRGCQANCKEKAHEDGSFTRCCDSKLCNAAPAFSCPPRLLRTVLVSAAVATTIAFISGVSQT